MKTLFANQLRCLRWAPMMCVILSLAPSGGLAATRSPIILSGGASSLTLGFASRLWEQLYRAGNDELEHQDDEANPDHVNQSKDSATPGQYAQDRLKLVQPEQVASQIVADFSPQDPEEISHEESSVPGIISDWNIAKMSATHGDGYTTRSGGGPTATTILVGLVAAIVLMGALFSGKE